MKKYILCLAIGFLGQANIHAQATFQGQAVYESKRSIDAMMPNGGMRISGTNVTPEMQEQMKERMRKAFEKTFILNFDRTSSTYKEEEKLEVGGGNQGGMRMMMASMTGGGGTYYKDVKEKTFIVDKDLMGKEFLVKDTLKTYAWKMTGDTKKIGDYTAYKATAVIPVDGSDLTNFRPRQNPSNDNKEVAKSETKDESRTNFFSQMELPKEKTITAWYTPEIPINQGPDGYWGLPGLILEVNDGVTTIICSKVVINPKEKLDIKAPRKGKQVSQKEFTEISIKKMEEMREQFQNGRGDIRSNFGR